MIIPWALVAEETLNNLIENFVSSAGTDNGNLTTLEERVNQVKKMLEQGKAVLTFDEANASFSIILQETFPL